VRIGCSFRDGVAHFGANTLVSDVIGVFLSPSTKRLISMKLVKRLAEDLRYIFLSLWNPNEGQKE